MSGFQGANTTEGGNQFAELTFSSQVGSALTRILLAEAITPGDGPSYELCKLLYAFHPLGHKMAQKPIEMAQSQRREIGIPVSGEDRLKEAFEREWDTIGDGAGADQIIRNFKTQVRIYGISTLAMGDRNRPEAIDKEVDWWGLHEAAPYFSVFDPLNTAGSLTLNQDPNSPDFQKPTIVRVGNKIYHRSRVLVAMHESPLFIQWSDSAFGFSGRSVYQRALYPMKTFLQTMITDQWVTQKVGLLIYNAMAPGSVQNNRVMGFFGFKRSQIKAGVTGNVLTIGEKETLSSLNFQNLEGPAAMARSNSLKNTAMAASMPAKVLEQEELVEGLAEGTEDAKQIARWIDGVRIDMNPEYAFMDRVVQHRAWSPAFFEALKRDFTEYRRVDYQTAFYQWRNAFKPTWPNLLQEPESKQVEVEKTQFESAVAVAEIMAGLLRDPDNKAELAGWLADQVNARPKLFGAPLEIDTKAEAEAASAEPVAQAGPIKEPEPFSERT